MIGASSQPSVSQYGYSFSPEDGIYEDRAYCYNGQEAHPLFTTHHAIPRNTERTIRPDLDKLGLPQDIVNEASNIYQNMKAGTKRGKKRKQLIFFCVSSAYNTKGIPEDPNRLAEICGIDSSDISKSHSMCSSIRTNYEAPLVRYMPNDFVNLYFDKLSHHISFPEGALEDIYVMTADVMECDPDLSDEKPQTVAAAILVFYLSIHGASIEKSKYKSIFGRSDMTINKIKNKVSAAYNS